MTCNGGNCTTSQHYPPCLHATEARAHAPYRVRIREGWWLAGRLGLAVAPDVGCRGIAWTPVLWDDEEDPDFHKTAGLEMSDRVLPKE